MRLTITNNDGSNESVYYYLKNVLPGEMIKMLIELSDKNRLKYIDKTLNIKSLEVLKLAIKTMTILRYGTNNYILQTDKNIRYKEDFLDKYVRLISYGTREFVGYPLLKDVFTNVSNKINSMYKEWAYGNSLL